METISIDTFWKLLQDPTSAGFSIRYRKTDGTFGEKHNVAKSGKRFQGKSTKGKLRYDIIEKGSVLLQCENEKHPFTLRNRLLIAIRLRDGDWLRIIHKNY